MACLKDRENENDRSRLPNVFCKKEVLKNLQNSQAEITTLFKKRLLHNRFPVNVAKSLRTSFL